MITCKACGREITRVDVAAKNPAALTAYDAEEAGTPGMEVCPGVPNRWACSAACFLATTVSEVAATRCACGHARGEHDAQGACLHRMTLIENDGTTSDDSASPDTFTMRASHEPGTELVTCPCEAFSPSVSS